MLIGIEKLFISLLQRAAQLNRFQKRTVVILVDLALLLASIWLSYFLRTGSWLFGGRPFLVYSTAAIVLMASSFVWHGIYNTIFRYAGLGLVRDIATAIFWFSIGTFLIFAVWGFAGVPRTLAIIQPLVFLFFIVGWRYLIRAMILDVLGRGLAETRKVVLVYGSADIGQKLVAALRGEPELRVCGYIDDDQSNAGQTLDGVNVYWSGSLEGVIKSTGATTVLLALSDKSRPKRQAIIERLNDLDVEVQVVPSVNDIVSGQFSISDIRPLQVEDLLGRKQVVPSEALLKRTIERKTVLVTGAGGSIGSELCRQILAGNAEKLILLDSSEFALYRIQRELRDAKSRHLSDTQIRPLLCSVLDEDLLHTHLEAAKIDTVFHAAAYKHVPLVEENAAAAAKNNIVGTHILLRVCADHGVKDFILVSTDKAVRPTNVMGATKRASELVLQSFAAEFCEMRCSMVRFGNVLGSSGSVVPLFQKQIQSGGPITLTHKEVTRYFMTIPEAANLVIQAGGMAKGGEVFVLDMGKPVKIVDLARTMLKLSGLTEKSESDLDGDIEIVETGLRPGEKLFEELLIGNRPQPTGHPRIFMAHEDHQSWQIISKMVDELGSTNHREDIVSWLKSAVPEFDHKRDN